MISLVWRFYHGFRNFLTVLSRISELATVLSRISEFFGGFITDFRKIENGSFSVEKSTHSRKLIKLKGIPNPLLIIRMQIQYSFLLFRTSIMSHYLTLLMRILIVYKLHIYKILQLPIINWKVKVDVLVQFLNFIFFSWSKKCKNSQCISGLKQSKRDLMSNWRKWYWNIFVIKQKLKKKEFIWKLISWCQLKFLGKYLRDGKKQTKKERTGKL